MKSKIVYIITRSEIGGAQNHLLAILNRFSKDYDLTLITGSKGYLIDSLKKMDIDVKVHVVESVDSFNFVRSVLSLRKIFKQEQPDLIHVHSTLASINGRLAAAFLKIKVLYTVHGWHFANKKLPNRIVQIGAELTLKLLTTHWVVVSNYDFDLGNGFKLFKNNCANVIRNGIPDLKPSLLKKKDSHNNDRFDLVFIGRASFQKNHLEPIRVLEKCHSTVFLTMFIAGSDTLSLHDLIEKKKLGERCKVVLNDPNPSQSLVNSDALLVTSRYEGMPLSVIEGLRSSLPIVSTDVCGMNELVRQENGFLTRVEDTKGIADCIERLRVNKDLASSMGEASRALFLEKFTDEKMFVLLAKVYQKLL